jgi:hypothetical protein
MVDPIRHKPQVQPLTVLLANICRDYPGGGVVLREFLQNADDAGALSVVGCTIVHNLTGLIKYLEIRA